MTPLDFTSWDPTNKITLGKIQKERNPKSKVRLWLHLKACFQAFAQQDSLRDNVPFFKARGHCLQLSLQLSQSPLLLESLIKETLYDYSQENPTLKIRWSSHMEKGFPPCWRGISFTWSHVLTAYYDVTGDSVVSNSLYSACLQQVITGFP